MSNTTRPGQFFGFEEFAAGLGYLQMYGNVICPVCPEMIGTDGATLRGGA